MDSMNCVMVDDGEIQAGDGMPWALLVRIGVQNRYESPGTPVKLRPMSMTRSEELRKEVSKTSDNFS
jgi:hypothetical protein